MAQLTKRLATVLAAIVLGTTLLASGANAAAPASDPVSIAAVPVDTAHTTTVDGDPTDRDGEQHRRFCARLNTALTRLVENNVITREQKLRIMEAFDCVPKPTTTRPTTTSPRTAAAQ